MNMMENDIEEGIEEHKVDSGKPRLNLMKGLFDDAKATFMRLKENPNALGAVKKEKEIAIRQTVLAGLIAAEFAPGAEMINDATKDATIASRLGKIIKEKGPEAANAAKKMGLVKELYPNVPTWLISVFAAVDTAEVPLLGAAPELVQFLIDGFFNDPKNRIIIAKETFNTFKDIRKERNSEKIDQAKATFVSSDGGNQNG